MKTYPLVMGRLFNTPLLARASYARTVAHVLSSRMGDYEVDMTDDLEMTERHAYEPSVDKNGIMTIPIVGGLYHRGTEMDAMSGIASYSSLNNTMVKALDDPQVKGILLDIDSPGGEAGGCFSFADTVRNMSRIKPIWAVANSGAASAAYAIGSAASKFYAARDAMVGSIGVVWLHMDYSKHLEQQGVVASYVYAGQHKTDGNPFEPLEGEAKAEIQNLIDQRYEQFVSLVAANRSLSPEQVRATEAREYLADEAANIGLIDGVMSYAEARQAMASELSLRVPRVRVVNGVPIIEEN